MGFFDRLLLFFATLVLAGLALLTLFLVFGAVSLHYLGTMLAGAYGRVDLGVVALLVLVASIRLLLISFPREGTVKSIIQDGQLGSIAITLTAVENLVQRTVRGVRGVRESKTLVTAAQAGVVITVKVIVGSDLSVPTVANEIQELVQKQVEETIGITVTEVRISVENIGSEAQARVQ